MVRFFTVSRTERRHGFVQDLSNTLWAYGTLKHKRNEHVLAITSEVMRQIQWFSPQGTREVVRPVGREVVGFGKQDRGRAIGDVDGFQSVALWWWYRGLPKWMETVLFLKG